MISTSVTVPNIPKYSRSFSLDVCQLKPPTNNFPGAISPELFGVDLPDELPPLDIVWVVLLVLVFELLVLQFTVVAVTGNKALCKSCSTTVFASMTPLKID